MTQEPEKHQGKLYDLTIWDVEEQNRRAIFMNHMYKCSGRTNGLYTGLWQEFCMNEAGPYCKAMWFEQQRAIKEFIDKSNLRQLETLDLGEEPACKEEDNCSEPFVPTLHD
jgi:hypothetical protein